jgi:putative ABC transport system permease protein
VSATQRGVRNAFRRPGRTLAVIALVGLSVGLALSMAAAKSAVDAQVGVVRATTGTVLSISPSREGGFFVGPGQPTPTLNESDLAKLADEPHVAHYSLDLQAQLPANGTSLQSAFEAPRGFAGGGTRGGGNFQPPILAFGTTSPDRVPLPGGGAIAFGGPGGQAQQQSLDQQGFHLTEGTTFDGASHDPVALLGTRLAAKNNLTTGSTFTIQGQEGNETLTVQGVFDAGNDFANAAALLPLGTLQDLTGQGDKVSSAQVRVDSIENVATVQSDLQASLGDGAEVLREDESASAAIAPLNDVGSLAWTSLIGAVAAAGAITVLTMTLVVRERRREVGVLKAIGAAPRHILRQFAAESATLATLGVAAGLAFAAVADNAVLRLLERNSGAGAFGTTGLHASLGPGIIIGAFVAALLLALTGALVPALLVARIRPAEVLRGA